MGPVTLEVNALAQVLRCRGPAVQLGSKVNHLAARGGAPMEVEADAFL